MKVTIQLFGHFRKFGDQISLELADGSCIADMERAFVQAIAQRDPAFYENSALLASRFCDNADILRQDHLLNDGGSFAILPPVSGG
jgi:molybdopterin converting factor small subunit